MAGGWYYSHDGVKIGPFSGERLKELAACGEILLTDTVWKAGVEAGALASNIKNLFPPQVPVVATTPSLDVFPDEAEERPPPVTLPEKKPVPSREQPKPKKGTATAIKGADIVGQDGFYARYRMKCTTCGHKDASTRSIQISSKLTKTGYFCPKCKKRCEVAIQCRQG